jgi:hypothetical protein
VRQWRVPLFLCVRLRHACAFVWVCWSVQRCIVLRCHVRIGQKLSHFSALEKGLRSPC